MPWWEGNLVESCDAYGSSLATPHLPVNTKNGELVRCG